MKQTKIKDLSQIASERLLIFQQNLDLSLAHIEIALTSEPDLVRLVLTKKTSSLDKVLIPNDKNWPREINAICLFEIDKDLWLMFTEENNPRAIIAQKINGQKQLLFGHPFFQTSGLPPEKFCLEEFSKLMSDRQRAIKNLRELFKPENIQEAS